MKEILAHVDYQIKLSNFGKKLIGGIVLTGGGSQLKHLVQLTEMETGQIARVGVPKEHLATSKFSDIENPIYATGIGLLIRAFKQIDEDQLLQVKPDIASAEIAPAKTEAIIIDPNGDRNQQPSDMLDETVEKSDEPKIKKKGLISTFADKFKNYMQSDVDDFS
jgi:cell division ATPase FtsA